MDKEKGRQGLEPRRPQSREENLAVDAHTSAAYPADYGPRDYGCTHGAVPLHESAHPRFFRSFEDARRIWQARETVLA
jgi:hypothetical protein